MEILSYYDQNSINVFLLIAVFCLGCLFGGFIQRMRECDFEYQNYKKIQRIKKYKEYRKGILLSDGKFVEYDALYDSKIDQKIEHIIKGNESITFDLMDFLRDNGALFIDGKEILYSEKVILTEEQQKYLSDNMQYFNEEQKQGIANLQRESILYHHVKNRMLDSHVNNLMLDKKPEIEAVLSQKEKHGKRKK